MHDFIGYSLPRRLQLIRSLATILQPLLARNGLRDSRPKHRDICYHGFRASLQHL